MVLFQDEYKEFLLQKTKLKPNKAKYNKALKDLIRILSELNSIYPTGRLIDCDDEDDSLEGRIVLGRTNIGNI